MNIHTYPKAAIGLATIELT